MKSQQLLHLQQEFLKSLHSAPTPWLLDQITPADGFSGNSDEVLRLYLERAMVRTVDPLVGIFRCCRWLFGDDGLHALLKRFYNSCPGEPIAAQPLAYAFIGFLGDLNSTELAAHMVRAMPPGIEPYQAALELALLDGRRLWAQLAPRRVSPGLKAMLHRFHERHHRWARPRLDRGSRLALSRFDLLQIEEAVMQLRELTQLPVLDDVPAWFLLHFLPGAGSIEIQRLSPEDARLLSGCDGTMTITALCHQESFFGASTADTEARIVHWIESGVIVDLQTELTLGKA
ncbi:putative DNA-binding domain-containing protein [Cyanobium sp. LEGE 06143]|uniref:HvfC/BufC family peptide modification chaperone n=1 Tax=Cyanobium sp. LEGE 06143 TaxID=945727 RepID=UPI001882A49C|nr:putative DNA-binding domain-containing protein [Cyanobium sp. LEGE 06143]MBE9171672.1 putative DNA-binding domain-containing protein [Cyanobium sp. LEGE 06143]